MQGLDFQFPSFFSNLIWRRIFGKPRCSQVSGQCTRAWSVDSDFCAWISLKQSQKWIPSSLLLIGCQRCSAPPLSANHLFAPHRSARELSSLTRPPSALCACQVIRTPSQVAPSNVLFVMRMIYADHSNGECFPTCLFAWKTPLTPSALEGAVKAKTRVANQGQLEQLIAWE